MCAASSPSGRVNGENGKYAKATAAHAGFELRGRSGAKAPDRSSTSHGARMTATTLIATRASSDKKARFRALASSRGMDESKLLTLMIDRVLMQNPASAAQAAVSTAESARVRVTIRLRVGDGVRLAERARARGMKPATYLGALARAHLRGDPSLPMRELAQLKRAVAELSACGRNLNQIARVATESKGLSPGLLTQLQGVQAVIAQLRDSTAELIKANLISWEADHA